MTWYTFIEIRRRLAGYLVILLVIFIALILCLILYGLLLGVVVIKCT